MKFAGADGGPCDWAVICRKSCAEVRMSPYDL